MNWLLNPFRRKRPTPEPTPPPKRYGRNEPIPCSEVSPLRQWLDDVRDKHEPGGLYARDDSGEEW